MFRDSLLSGLSAILKPESGPPTPTNDAGEPVEAQQSNGNGSSHEPTAITKDHLEALYKYLDTQGGTGKIDYRKYGESLFDILIAGGLLGAYCALLVASCGVDGLGCARTCGLAPAVCRRPRLAMRFTGQSPAVLAALFFS